MSWCVFLDDQKARCFAQREGIPITGTLGLLELAATQGLISLADAIQELQATDFHLATHLLAEALERDAIRQQEQRQKLEGQPGEEH
jgi:predicted nucleic acid-binding protein